MHSRIFFVIGMACAVSVATGGSLPMFGFGNIEYTYDYDLAVNDRTMISEGRQVGSMGMTRRGFLCYRKRESLVGGLSGFYIGENGLTQESGMRDNCTYTELKVIGNRAEFNIDCRDGGPSMPAARGKVVHHYQQSANRVTQQFTGTGPYGKTSRTNTYRNIGACY